MAPSGDVALPVRVIVDAEELPTNASRSEVRNDAPLLGLVLHQGRQSWTSFRSSRSVPTTMYMVSTPLLTNADMSRSPAHKSSTTAVYQGCRTSPRTPVESIPPPVAIPLEDAPRNWLIPTNCPRL